MNELQSFVLVYGLMCAGMFIAYLTERSGK